MQDIFSSVRRSLVFRPSPDAADDSPTPVASTSAATGIVEKINSCIRKSIAFNKQSPPPSSPSPSSSSSPFSNSKENVTAIRWRKGELIGCGAFGRVYMGLNLDSGELIAVKQVLTAANSSSKEKAQTHIRELEEEVKLLKNLSHPNIVRYLGTVREEDSLNILLEFVPGGSISSLLGKFGAFPETVVRTYTTQLLLGLEYLHKNGIMHRDIKGANILVDNKGRIKLADFGASKQVVELATITGAKSMKGTPYWMAPEVILQTGHSFSADIWSVGCTVIEMATGKPPWSQQYQEVAALFHIGTTKSHPPIPEHLSDTAKDFLLKCLQKEPGLRQTASQLLQHAFITGKHGDPSSAASSAAMEKSGAPSGLYCANRESFPLSIDNPQKLSESKCMWEGKNDDDDMCQIDGSLNSVVHLHDGLSKSFNPMCEPSADWSLGFDGKTHLEERGMALDTDRAPFLPSNHCGPLDDNKKDFSSCGTFMEDDDELTESKIKAFLDEKAIELKKLQTPLYEEFFNSLNAACSPGFSESIHDDTARSYLKLPPKSRSPSCPPAGTPSAATEGKSSKSPGSNGSKYMSNVGNVSNQSSPDVGSPQLGDRRGLLVENSNESCSPSFSERQKMWKEELDQELQRKREMMRQAVAGGKTSSPKDRAIKRQRDRTRFASPGSCHNYHFYER